MDFPARLELTVGKKFRLNDKIFSGVFAAVYNAVDMETGKEVRVKLEIVKSFSSGLRSEASLCKKLENGKGFAKVLWRGRDRGYNVLVTDQVGPSIRHLFQSCSHEFSLKTVLMLCAEMVNLVEHLHRNHHIHGDIKPDNFCVGHGGNSKQIFLIDFGSSVQYRSSSSLRHVKCKEDLEFRGNTRFASVNAQQGFTLSRRDDMESLGYIFVYLLKGSLPWQWIRAENRKERLDKILRMKMTTPFKDLCQGLPKEFRKYLEYCHRLGFSEDPDYNAIRKLFCDLFLKQEFQFDDKFDWDSLPNAGSTNSQNLF